MSIPQIATATVCAAFLAALPGMARSVPVTLDYDEGFRLLRGNDGLDGVWLDKGFKVSGQTREYIPPGSVADLGTISSNLTGYEVSVRHLEISRIDGGAFDLTSLDIPRLYIGESGRYSGDTTGADGGPTHVENVIPLLYETVALTGTTASDTTVQKTFLAKNAPIPAEKAGLNYPHFWQNTNSTFTSDRFGDDFTDLVSLEFESAGSRDADATDREIMCRPENLLRADPIFSMTEFCAGKDPKGGPLVDQSFDIIYTGPRNDTSFFALRDMTVTPRGTGPPPAAAPLPGSALLLLGGLAGLFALRRRA